MSASSPTWPTARTACASCSSPRPRRRATTGSAPGRRPGLIATFKLPLGGKALAISKGVDRDRAVDESGNQIGVFGRVGARPLNAEEQRKMYLHNGRLWTVSDDPLDPVYRRVAESAAIGHALKRRSLALDSELVDSPGRPIRRPGSVELVRARRQPARRTAA